MHSIYIPLYLGEKKNFCTEATLKSFLEHYGILKTQEQIHKEVPYFEHPNLIPYLIKTTGKTFIKPSKITSLKIKEIIQSSNPILLRLNKKHTVVVVGYNDGIHVLDPAKGKMTLSFDEVLKNMTGAVYIQNYK